jgi:hypothetical protein
MSCVLAKTGGGSPMTQTPEERQEAQIAAMAKVKLPLSPNELAYLGDDLDEFGMELFGVLHARLIAYFDAHEPITPNIIRNGPPTVEQLTEIIESAMRYPIEPTPKDLAEIILEELSK